MRIIFAGYPEIGIPSLEKLSKKHEIAGVLTHPDRVSGRGKKRVPPPIKVKAEELGIPVFQTEKIDKPFMNMISSLKPDILVVVAYGKILKKDFIDLFPRGGVNLHPSLLPLYRGPSPIQAAILNGDSETGITVQRIAVDVDSGDILDQLRIPLYGTETTLSLTGRISILGADLLLRVLDDIEKGKETATPQDNEKATYCTQIRKEDGIIRWDRQGALEISRMVRAFNPWPKAYTWFKGKTLAILEAGVYAGRINDKARGPGYVYGVDKDEGILIQTIDGILAVKKLQLQSKKPLEWRAFINGIRDFPGSTLGVKR